MVHIQEMLDQKAIEALQAISAKRQHGPAREQFKDLWAIWDQLPELSPEVDGSDAWVNIGPSLSNRDPRRDLIEKAARALMPWKKGPFRLCGIEIDAEWRSDLKWDRFATHLPSQQDKIVLDLGCNNGYTLFRLLPQQPRLVLGVDPVARPAYQFELMQRFAGATNLQFEMWGWEELDWFKELFDTILCMGILYHHRNPLGILKNLRDAMKPGALLVMESIVIPGEESYCLFPPDRYARMRNVWFLPTVSALSNMLQRTRFTDIEIIAVNRHTSDEQRTTPWNPAPSHADFLDPHDGERTVEGLPAPYRAILFARKRG